MKYIISCIILTVSLIGFAQDKAPELPRFAIRGNIGIPKVVSSQSFRNSFSGVIEGNANVTCKLVSDFIFGVGYSYTYYKSQKAFRDQSVNTNMQSQNGYLKLGYDKFYSDNGFVTFSVNMGYNFNQYKGLRYRSDTLIGKYPTEFSSAFVEPVIGLYLMVDPNFAIGGHLSYNYNFSKFDPTLPGFDRWLEYRNLKNNWNMSMITLGFGFYYGLKRK